MMIYLTEISVPLVNIREAASQVSPLTASDPDYAVKTWMHLTGAACRPWRQYSAPHDRIRVVGWRAVAPSGLALGAEARVVSRAVAIEPGENLHLSGLIVPIRRSQRGTVARDAAAGFADRAAAYRLWLEERLVDIRGAMDISAVDIARFATVNALRKRARRAGRGNNATELVVGPEPFPRVEASVTGTVKDPARIEAWLLNGLGPQKAFGYGGFFPC